MNFTLKYLPEREIKPRTKGLTMVMDKGLSTGQTEDILSIANSYIDLVKLGWTTSMLTPNLTEKLDLYRQAKIPVFFGGTLFEAFVVRGQFEDYLRVLERFKMEYVEVSDGSITISHEKKCEYIKKLNSYAIVLSEIGSKDETLIIPPDKWTQLMQAEIKAGAWKVITEARENGNVGMFQANGDVRPGLVEEILTKIPQEKIIWEAPKKSQQVWFLKLLGSHVNLGNISPSEIIPLETLRLGLRGDTFNHFLKAFGKLPSLRNND